MRKVTFMKEYLKKTGILLLSLVFVSSLWGQNTEQQRNIQKRTDVKGLKTLEENVKKTDFSVIQLQAKAKQLNIPFSYEFDNKLYQLRSFDKKGLPLYYVTYNIGAAAGTFTDKLYPSWGIFNLDGDGMLIREWDGGKVLTNHAEFQNRATQKDAVTTTSDHSTHVAGTMIAAGLDPKAKGMAYKAKLDAYDWNSDTEEMAAAAAAGALVSNHSYGYTGGFTWNNPSGVTAWHWYGSDEDTEYIGYGYYSDTDSLWDAIVAKAPYYLPVKAAGNPRGDGPEPGGKHYVRILENGSRVWKESTKVRQKNGGQFGFDCLVTGNIGKNILVVAAAEKITGGYKAPSDVKVASFSGFGPTDDGRIKPDIAGIGVELYSTNNVAGAYTTMSGTSMASPNVTGSLALLQQHYKNLNAGQFMRAATLKALAIHTANEAGDAPGPDYKHGWGLLNSFKAAQIISMKDQYSLIKENTLTNTHRDTIKVIAAGGDPLAVTIAWTDPAPGVLPNYELNNPMRMLVNDLDLRVVKKGETEDQTFNPWILDPANPANAATTGDNIRDNIEQVVVNNPVKGAEYLIIVSHKATLQKNSDTGGLVNADNQDYALITTGINNNISKDLEVLTVKPTVEPAAYSTATPIAITYKNKGNSDIAAAAINYSLINKDNNNTVVTTGTLNITDLPSGTTRTDNIALNLSTSFVNYTITAEAQLEGDQVATNNKSGVDAYGILANLTTLDAKHTFDFETDFVKNGWLSEDIDGDDRTWRKYDDASFAKSGASFAINFPNLAVGNNDWLFSNPLKLTGNTAYRVIFNTRKLRTTPEENIQVSFGSSPTSANMTTTITPIITATTSYVRYAYEFTPTADGVYYVGFHSQKGASEQSYAVFLDDVAFQQAASKPDIEFTASNVKPNTFETVTFTNETKVGSTVPVTAYKWTFSPATVTFTNGTSDVTENPQVIFNAQGTYSVTLKVTNSVGESTLTKTGYIVAANTATKALFTASKTAIFENDIVKFTNTSTGNPAPTNWLWNITPNQDFEFQNGTNATSKDIEIKFNKKGTYAVKLTATSQSGSNTSVATNVVVSTYYETVTGLAYTYNETTKDLTLTWKRPSMLGAYTEGFEYGGAKPADFTFQDEDSNPANWQTTTLSTAVKTGKYGIASYSWSLALDAYDVDNWMITGKVRSDVEQLKFWSKNRYKEQYEIFVVPAPASGNAPTLAEIKAGTKVYDFAGVQGDAMKEVVVDLAPANITTDVFIAFHHKTRAVDNGYYLAIDDINVGYKAIAPAGIGTSPADDILTEYENLPELDKEKMKSGKYLFVEPTYVYPIVGEKITYTATTYPQLTGYQVQKDGSLLQAISGKNKLMAVENIAGQTGTHVYDLYAVYSDDVKSDKQSVTVTYTVTSTNDFSVEQMKVYPNPTKGTLYITGEEAIKSLSITLHDLSGRKVFEKKSNGNKTSVDLSRYYKGAYVLTIRDNQNRKQALNIVVN